MQSVNIVVRDMANSPTLEEHLRRKAKRLGHFYNRIQTMHIALVSPQKHQRHGKIFNLRIALTVPGNKLIVNRQHDEDVYVSIRNAFDALVRKLETYARKRRGEIKTHDPVAFGHVTRLFPQQGYGFIQGVDGNELYFSMNNVSHPCFADLMVGDPVQFLGVTGPDGWQAHRITKENFTSHNAW